MLGGALSASAVVAIVLLPPHSASNANMTSPGRSVEMNESSATVTVNSSARIEIENQTATTLSIKVFDAGNAEYDLSMTRGTTNDVWTSSTSASLGILFGNTQPRYAGSALRRSLGISPAEAIRTFDTSIVNRPMDDVTIFKTYEGVAIGLWQEGVITEIWYVGSFIEEAITRTVQEETPMCDANVDMCCNQINIAPDGDPPHWIPDPNLDGCAAALQCTQQHQDQACACLENTCGFCAHPPPQPPPADDPCSPELQQKSEQACQMGGPACEVPDPPPPPITIEDIWDLLREILDRLQEFLDTLIN